MALIARANGGGGEKPADWRPDTKITFFKFSLLLGAVQGRTNNRPPQHTAGSIESVVS